MTTIYDVEALFNNVVAERDALATELTTVKAQYLVCGKISDERIERIRELEVALDELCDAYAHCRGGLWDKARAILTTLEAPQPTGDYTDSIDVEQVGTACKHPLETMNHHSSITGIAHDFRCTLCDLVMSLTDEEVSRWYGLHSKAKGDDNAKG